MAKSLNLFVPTKAPSHRQKRVAQEIRHYLAEVFMRGDFPPRYTDDGDLISLPAPVTITDISLSPDLKHAVIFVMPLGGNHKEETLEFLKAASNFLRKCLSKQLLLRGTPKLIFQIDQGLEEAQKIEALLKKI